MPDGDRIPVGIYGRWRRVFRYLDAQEPVERIADAVASAVASDFRRAGGAPELHQLANAPRDAADALSNIYSQPTPQRAEQLTAVLAMTMSDHLALNSPAEAAYALAERVVNTAILSRLDRMVHRLVGDQKYGAVELHNLFKRVIGHEQMAKLVQRLLKHPTGKGLRAPNKRLPPLSRPLMDTDLSDL